MVVRIAFALALAWFLAGCTAPMAANDDSWGNPVAWEPLPCDPTGATTISNNARIAGGIFGRSAVAIATDIVAALGDRLANRIKDSEWENEWATTGGGTIYVEGGGAHLQARYERDGAIDEGDARAVLAKLKVNHDAMQFNSYDHASFANQVAFGEALGGYFPFGAAWGSNDEDGNDFLMLLTLYELRAVEDPRPAGSFFAEAETFARCQLATEGNQLTNATLMSIDLAWLTVDSNSVVRVTMVEFQGQMDRCQRTFLVGADAVTGAILGMSNDDCT